MCFKLLLCKCSCIFSVSKLFDIFLISDPLFNSSASTSVASTLNVNPSSSNSNSTSTAAPATNKAATVSLPHAKKGFAILNEEEGGAATAEKPADTKKVFNVYSQDSDYESSDDENIAPKVLNNTKQKFK